ncbi:protein suppressor of sable [Musca domestica]|uniref:Protein suppressor of sable n=1 Tax=Musca domestica TaxID=7370 RepID=A0A9J7D9C3_MUSDO|nr:protein suppressor of sable [Musca domestica]XP_011293349.2 protein suppressor of sable [Musca domestica]XP_011293350.2 protein suppressor of sable [Musca domestica]XP_011293351.2 protein suppressor of sable [Musca domestica]
MSQQKEENPNKAEDEQNDEEMEDGEIDDSDEEATPSSTAAAASVEIEAKDTAPQKPQEQQKSSTIHTQANETTAGNQQQQHQHQQSSKSKKPQPPEDDYASKIQKALEDVLIKKGVEPTIPKIVEAKKQQHDHSDESGAQGGGQGQSKSSRRRKRKRQREEKEKEKEKERLEKRKRQDTNDPLGPPPLGDEMDMDEFEMMNVRGGSPPPLAALPLPPPTIHLYDDYDSRDESASSYDSYDSNGEGSNGERRRRRKKESRRRKEKRAERHEKRSRRESLDEKHRNEPRKLELCKFYLMECCAKRDKCSYMHADFPCKYYYLGMECTAKDDCKFAHGEPLSEELRNILLKHLETAPKEILGNFKRLSRENSINMITKRHEELCRKFNVQNVWAPINANSLPMNNNRRNNNSNNSNNNNNNNNNKNNDHNHQRSQNAIPSLLDLVIPAPNNMDMSSQQFKSSNESKRKSRWADNNSGNSSSGGNNQNSSVIQPPSKSAPSYLDLKNLTGILSQEHIEKLSQMGIVNLEQVNQLTFGQLNQIGLTIAEITEIQLNAMNMAKLTGSGAGGGGSSLKQKTTDNTNKSQDLGKMSNGDVDMRFLPNVPAASTATSLSTTSAVTSQLDGLDKDTTNSSNSNSSSGVVVVDYSQYLKDSNLSFDKGDIYDDEKDDEQLVIDDDDNIEAEESTIHKSSSLDQSHNSLNTQTYDNGFASKLHGSMSDTAKNLRNPFRTGGGFYGSADSKLADGNAFKSPSNDDEVGRGGGVGGEDLYYTPLYMKSRQSRDSRSRSRTPPSQNTPEGSQSPKSSFDRLRDNDESPEEATTAKVIYERSTIYDYNNHSTEEDVTRLKTDKDMRFLPGSLLGDSSTTGDTDLRLPFQPMTNYTPATEIDGSITSHLPITYKVYVVDVPQPSYNDLKQHFKSDQTTDPRLRRILGLPELSPSKTSSALSRKVRKSSNTSIASPSETEDASPRYYTPPSSSTSEDRLAKTSSRSDPRSLDPRGDPRSSDPRQTLDQSRTSDPRTTDPRSSSSDPRRADPRSGAAASTSTSTADSSSASNPAGGQKQNVEIRNLLQKSEWYKNLNSKFKIMVNQQLALVSTELKKFHQDPSPNKIFDISFIVNNQTLQQILTNLGIYIDDNGEVAHLEGDGDENGGDGGGPPDLPGNHKSNITLPNLSQPPPNAANQLNNNSLDFLRAPPPNMVPQGPPPNIAALGPMFQRPPMPFARPSLLGLPPGQGNPMNPFNNPMNNLNLNINPNFIGGGGGPGLLGPFVGGMGGGPGPNFVGGMPPQMQQNQRNFNNNQRNNNRNQNKRRI